MVFIIAACLLLLALLNPVLVNIISPLRSCRVETRRADCAFACSLLICLLLYFVAFVLFLPVMVPILAIVAFAVIWELLPFCIQLVCCQICACLRLQFCFPFWRVKQIRLVAPILLICDYPFSTFCGVCSDGFHYCCLLVAACFVKSHACQS